jgi:hypothetical protein
VAQEAAGQMHGAVSGVVTEGKGGAADACVRCFVGSDGSPHCEASSGAAVFVLPMRPTGKGVDTGAGSAAGFVRSPKRRRAWAREVEPRVGISLCTPNLDHGSAGSWSHCFHFLFLLAVQLLTLAEAALAFGLAFPADLPPQAEAP